MVRLLLPLPNRVIVEKISEPPRLAVEPHLRPPTSSYAVEFGKVVAVGEGVVSVNKGDTVLLPGDRGVGTPVWLLEEYYIYRVEDDGLHSDSD